MDVLCIGHASYDLVFSVPHHPDEDEKCVATDFVGCGGGPAANAAVTVARLGRRGAFAGYLGRDLYGQAHWQELQGDGVATDWIVRGDSPTPLSAVLVKPDGRRSLVSYRGDTRPLPPKALDLSRTAPACVLYDGHEPELSIHWHPRFRQQGIATVLDAGSLHRGTEALMFAVDYLLASRKFAAQWLGRDDPEAALSALAQQSPAVVITLGEEGVIWQRGSRRGRLPAFPIRAVDTTGAGDTFHGAFCVAVVEGRDWETALRFASAAAALCCTQMGARPGIPRRGAVEALLAGGSV
ncbi:sulfofructose kinase [Methylomarinovum caldicuralii]|uniref:Sulfofructose kinase n=1 Tax=Methylomarinovum caldicuralii TaxID=438856 RepID=A0AAU9C6C9_9GAMM|nr:PfkB family carbohydrate kinase [Methylomarinovum caldicuralii]BCX82800.1 sulfofructose kinase [Methylomarinovum caldicuralii]